MAPDGSGFRVVHAFTGPDGLRPHGLLQASDGTLYGTTSAGGAFGVGTIFQLTLDGTYTVVHHFSSADGADPQDALMQASDGNFYGTTLKGGAFNRGVVFQMTPDSTVTVMYEFTNRRVSRASTLGGKHQNVNLKLPKESAPQ